MKGFPRIMDLRDDKIDVKKINDMKKLKILLNWYFSRRSLPYWCILLFDCLIVFLSGILVFLMFVRAIDYEFLWEEGWHTIVLYTALSLIGFKAFRTYSGVLRYASFIDLKKVAYANLLNLVLTVGVSQWIYYSNSNVFHYFFIRHTFTLFVIATMLMWFERVFVKMLYEVASKDYKTLRVLIFGAMDGGIGLAKYIKSQRPIKYDLKGFISHQQEYASHWIMGVRVYGVNDNLKAVIEKNGIEAILVSPLRKKDFRDNEALQDLLIDAGVKILMTQDAKEINVKEGESPLGDTNDYQMKEVSVEDLLPRAEIKVDMKSVGELLGGKKILITGAAGSIGSEMVRQIAIYKPAAMLLIDQAETPEHDVRLMMSKEFPEIEAKTVVTSICKPERMEKLFAEFRPDYVFHAAAYKHVPMMEDNPSEAVQNNVYGTKVIADLSVKYGVKKFVMVSTDKAVNPTNVMGCSKRICEIYVQSLDRELKYKQLQEAHGKKSIEQGEENMPTQFVTTRFGNVLGSNGSVIPLFREQIKNGGPVTVTHKDIIRYFMLIPEACKLVLEAGTKGNGGEIFVFDMGKPVRIADLAARMIHLSGAKNVKIEYTGLREGEKLYEEVLGSEENAKPTFHEKIRIAQVREYDYEEVSREIDELIDISKNYDDMATVKKMKEIVPEYKSNNSIYEALD